VKGYPYPLFLLDRPTDVFLLAPQMSKRSDTVTSEMKRQVDKASVIKKCAMPSEKWSQYAEDASSKIRLSSKRGLEEEEISRGIVLVGEAHQVRKSGFARLAYSAQADPTF